VCEFGGTEDHEDAEDRLCLCVMCDAGEKTIIMWICVCLKKREDSLHRENVELCKQSHCTAIYHDIVHSIFSFLTVRILPPSSIALHF